MSATQRNLVVAIAALALVLIGVLAIALHRNTASHPDATASSATAPSTPPISSATTATLVRCHSADLSIAYRLGNGASNHDYALYTITNTSTHPCTLYGYPGVQLIADGTPIPTNTYRGGNYILDPAPPSTVTLPPGGTAAFGVGWTGICPDDATPVKAASTAIIPPDEQQQIRVEGAVWECPQDQTVAVTPVRAPGVPVAIGGDSA